MRENTGQAWHPEVLSLQRWIQEPCLSGPQRQLFLVNSAPIAAVTGHQPSSDQQDKVNKPPNPKSSKGQELPHCCAGVSQAETVYSKTSQEERVKQSGYEVVSGIPRQREPRRRCLPGENENT